MRNGLWIKGIAVGIIMLFIGTSIVPSINGDIEVRKNSIINQTNPKESYVPLDQDQLDQYQTLYNVDIGSMYHYLAQSFKPTLNTLTRIFLLLNLFNNTNYNANYQVSIRNNIDGNNLTNYFLDSSKVKKGHDWYEFDIPDIQVTPENTYYIVIHEILTGDISNGVCGYHNNGGGDAYLRGEASWMRIDGTWAGMSNHDFCFKTYGLNDNPPYIPNITGTMKGDIHTSYNYIIKTTDPEQNNVQYYIDWGDNTNSTTDFYESGKQITVSHIWSIAGTYSVRVKAVDEYTAESDWVTLSVTMPYSYKPIQSFLVFLFQRFPTAFLLLQHLTEY